ncbi:hypothetical protein M407DRAFT_19004 [Tulasnella calospora MUT 4182]|uniref:NADP-dependent oxidoreductase domain-containing protein n=1 Tax=Tulasnella calospora MUT 4182 TaxID=1051891 RepID=A0A0C3QSL8_9AGAM|nr:hypothetical protein M407DRAFT_19004 [Tulasnella calospora MUT 4182]
MYTSTFSVRRRNLSLNQHIFGSVNASLKRLELDYIDALQCHRFDYNTPIEETMQALHDVVQTGLVRYIGMSSCYAWQFHKMQTYAKRNNLTQFISMPNFYNAIYREEEREMVPLLQDLSVGMVPWSPLARGFLTRPIPKEREEANVRAASDQFFRFAGDPEKEKWLGVINERVSMAQVALAWVLSKPHVAAPIVGTTSIEKLMDLVAGVHLKLTEDEVMSIDEPYQPRPIEGHF